MFRKLILSAALSTAALGGFAMMPATADASPPVASPDFGYRYELMYLDCGRWHCYGTYQNHVTAERIAQQLRFRGLQTRVITVRC